VKGALIFSRTDFILIGNKMQAFNFTSKCVLENHLKFLLDRGGKCVKINLIFIEVRRTPNTELGSLGTREQISDDHSIIASDVQD
jgi:hypothetical protein